MGTSVHIPKPLLAAVDRKAKTLQLSRNKLIIRALEREVKQGSDWSPDFFGRLMQADNDVAAAADEALAIVRASRRSKKPPKL
jgi:metal-responsive CopG/Arc/MetJ family transcriptional regulator